MIVDSELLWSQRHRPRRVDDAILPLALKKVMLGIVTSKQIPNMVFAGKPGVGKTTAALALCDELGYESIVLNGSGEDRGIDAIKGKITRFASTMSMDGSRKCVVFDEADNMTNDAQLALRAVIEAVSKNCSFILTANYAARLDSALLSRCDQIDFVVSAAEAMDVKGQIFKRCRSILKLEGVENDPAAVAGIVDRCFPDFRKTLNTLQRLSRAGKIDAETASAFSGDGLESLIAHLKSKSMQGINEWVAETTHTIESVNRWIDDNGASVFAGDADWAQATLDCSEHDYKNAFVADQKLNMKALFVRLSSKCRFK
jgi:DNA polymerase III delta prime subunit